MDALSIQKSAGHPYASDKGHSQGNFVLDPHARTTVVKGDTQAFEREGVHLVSGAAYNNRV